MNAHSSPVADGTARCGDRPVCLGIVVVVNWVVANASLNMSKFASVSTVTGVGDMFHDRGEVLKSFK